MMTRIRQASTGTLALLIVAALVLSSGPFVGLAAAEPTVDVDYDAVVEPGEQTTITVNGTDAGDISISGELEGWIVNDTSPSSLTTFPNGQDTPYVTQSDDSWGHIFAGNGDNSFIVTVTAPETTGTYNLTAEVAGNETSVTENFTVTVTETSVSVDHEATVTQGTQTTVTVNGTNAGDLSLEGEIGDWIVNETSPAGLSTFPSPSQTPYVTQQGDVWGHVYSSVGNHSFEATVTPPNATGTYNFTATAAGTNTTIAEGFSINVTEATSTGPPEDVSEETYDAATGGDDELSREDILTVVFNYLNGDPIGQNIDVPRDELLALIESYISR
jgi:hypothetical protein